MLIRGETFILRHVGRRGDRDGSEVEVRVRG